MREGEAEFGVFPSLFENFLEVTWRGQLPIALYCPSCHCDPNVGYWQRKVWCFLSVSFSEAKGRSWKFCRHKNGCGNKQSVVIRCLGSLKPLGASSSKL